MMMRVSGVPGFGSVMVIFASEICTKASHNLFFSPIFVTNIIVN